MWVASAGWGVGERFEGFSVSTAGVLVVAGRDHVGPVCRRRSDCPLRLTAVRSARGSVLATLGSGKRERVAVVPGASFTRSWKDGRRCFHGNRNRQVVQRPEGFRVHHARRGW